MSDNGFLTSGNRQHVFLLNPVIGTDLTGNGFMTIDIVGEDVDPGEVLYMKADGKYWLADADSAAEMPAKGMAMETILADADGLLLHIGYFRQDAWDWTLGNGEANLLFVHTTPGAVSYTHLTLPTILLV